jgi:hypothetical protein
MRPYVFILWCLIKDRENFAFAFAFSCGAPASQYEGSPLYVAELNSTYVNFEVLMSVTIFYT